LSRARTAAIVLFVVVVLGLWIRHQRARDERNRRFAEALATTKVKEAQRVVALRAAAAQPLPTSPSACPVKTRARVVRLDSIAARGGSLHDVTAAIADEKEPAPWLLELDVADGRAFLYDYVRERVVCVGTDAEDPHGTLVAYDAAGLGGF
jgi:hypothetical protein